MHAADAIERLATLAHDLWRDRLEQDQWRPGPEFDAARRRHDALVPFERLTPRDRRQALLGVTALDLLSTLAESVWYERGPARLFETAEMREDLLVGWNDEDCASSEGAPPEPGRVVAWDSDGEGILCRIVVEWAEGSRSEHEPEDRELRRLGEAPAGPDARTRSR